MSLCGECVCFDQMKVVVYIEGCGAEVEACGGELDAQYCGGGLSWNVFGQVAVLRSIWGALGRAGERC